MQVSRVGQSLREVGAVAAVNAVVEENAAATEEVLAQVEQVSASATCLMEMAQELQKIVAQFALSANSQYRVNPNQPR